MLLVINAVWGGNLTLVWIRCINLHSFDECMERVLCWPWTSRPYVYISWIWHVLLVIDAVWGRNLTCMRCSKYIMYNNNGSALIFIRWLNVWNGCRVGAGWSARTFVLLRVCLNWAVLLVIDTVFMRLQSHRLIHYNDDDGFTLIFVRWTYEIGVVLALVE